MAKVVRVRKRLLWWFSDWTYEEAVTMATETRCQDCGNFPVPEGSPVAEAIETLKVDLAEAMRLAGRHSDQWTQDDYESMRRIKARWDVSWVVIA